MKAFVIYLPEYQTSVEMAQRAVNTGQAHGWDIELYAGVNGIKNEWTNVKPCELDAKCREMLQRPGVRGCFLSHWQLWNLCATQNSTVAVFEHDIEFVGPPPSADFDHVLKLEGFLKKKTRPAGEWYEGARAYILKPQGAQRLIAWTNQHGALPADVAIGLDVVDIKLWQQPCVRQHALYGKTDKRSQSFTWNLEGMK